MTHALGPEIGVQQRQSEGDRISGGGTIVRDVPRRLNETVHDLRTYGEDSAGSQLERQKLLACFPVEYQLRLRPCVPACTKLIRDEWLQNQRVRRRPGVISTERNRILGEHSDQPFLRCERGGCCRSCLPFTLTGLSGVCRGEYES